MKNGRLAGKVAIVTGAAQRTPGIGNGTADRGGLWSGRAKAIYPEGSLPIS